MKSVLYLLLFSIITSCVSETTPVEKFIIRGELQGLGNNGVRLSYRDSVDRGKWLNDTVYAKNDKFEFEGKVKRPDLAYIYILDSTLTFYSPAGDKYPAMPITFYLSNDVITVRGDHDNSTTVQLSGNEFNEGRTMYAQLTGGYNSQGNELLKKSLFTEDTLKKAELLKQRSELFHTADSLKRIFLDNNPDQIYSAYLISKELHKIKGEQLTRYYDAFTEDVKASVYGKFIGKKVDGFKVSAVGSPAFEFELTDKDGKLVRLSDFKGKVVLLDFWGSWCAPCRITHPHLRELYQTYHDQGLEIIGIAKDDNEKKWLKAIEVDKINWIHINGVSHLEEVDLFGKYYITAFPTKILIDSEGNIAERIIGNGEAIDTSLEDGIRNLLNIN